MNQLCKSGGKLPIPTPPPLPGPIPSNIDIALETFQRAMDTAVAIAAKREDARTERALITAKKEIEIAAIEATTQREMANDQHIHERRLMLIQYIGNLLVNNAQALTPEIMSAANALLQALREER